MPNGTMVGRALAVGRNLMDRIDNWYKVNGPPLAAHFFEISPRCTSAFVTEVTKDESDDEFDAGPTVRELEGLENCKCSLRPPRGNLTTLPRIEATRSQYTRESEGASREIER